jgi:hypothetical protein
MQGGSRSGRLGSAVREEAAAAGRQLLGWQQPSPGGCAGPAPTQQQLSADDGGGFEKDAWQGGGAARAPLLPHLPPLPMLLLLLLLRMSVRVA